MTDQETDQEKLYLLIESAEYFDANMNKKNDCFEYLIDSLAQRNNGSLEGFTTLKLIKLLFLIVGVSSTEEEPGLTTFFNNFVAMPYGPVESDIYNAIQEKSLMKYSITASKCEIINDITITIEEEQRKAMDDAISLLLGKNPKILKSQPFELVDITHKWSCWKICYNWALKNGKKSTEIPSQMIQNSVKYYQ